MSEDTAVKSEVNKNGSMLKKLVNSGIFWTFVFGILGFVLTILFYEFSNKEREPVYAIKKAPSIIFDKDNSTPKIKLLSKDSNVINDNVYISSIVIWNNGELEITKADVRKDIIISVTGESKILDYKIVTQTNPEISNFTIEPLNGKLKLDWNYFDPKFGLELQVIYSGTQDSKINVEGYVIGKKMVEVIPRRKNNILTYLPLLTLIFLWIVIIRPIKRLWKYKDKPTYILLVLTIVFSIYICLITYYQIFKGINLPL